MRVVTYMLLSGIILLIGLKWAVSANSAPPNQAAIDYVWLSIEALENTANHIENADETPEELADNLRLRAETIRIGLSEIQPNSRPTNQLLH